MDRLLPIQQTGENARQNAGFFAGSFQNPFVEAFQRTLLQDIAAPTLHEFSYTEPTTILEAAPSGLSTVFILSFPFPLRGECARRSSNSVAQPTRFQVRAGRGDSRRRSSGGSPAMGKTKIYIAARTVTRAAKTIQYRGRRSLQLGRSLSSGAVQWDDIEGRCRGVIHESRRDQLGDTAARA